MGWEEVLAAHLQEGSSVNTCSGWRWPKESLRASLSLCSSYRDGMTLAPEVPQLQVRVPSEEWKSSTGAGL